jgi:outer membrane protein OmpA-like peptidoglycan-associated protein
MQRPSHAAKPMALLCAALWSLTALAGVQGPQISFGPHVGAAIWETSEVSLEEDVLFGARLALAPNSWFGLEGSFDVNPTHVVGDADLAHRISHLGLGALLNLAPYRAFSPYLSLGWSQLHFDPKSSGERTFNGWESGVGFRWRLVSGDGRQVSFRLDARNLSTPIDAGFLAVSNSDRAQNNLLVTAGIEFALGGAERDGDGDGVADRRDKCPSTAQRALVDAFGCALDSDEDGVADGIDVCANTLTGARVDGTGCPTDVDADGVADGIDRCDDTPNGARVDELGCAIDSDADGVADGIDRCPQSIAGLSVDAQGCALDADSDGVHDSRDRCAGTPVGVQVDASGCPAIQNAREQELLDTGRLRLENVYFESGKAELKTVSFAALDEVGEILVRWPQLRIEIGGHTDSRGDEYLNQRLSEARAQSVFDYLARRFPEIQVAQFRIRGYGESRRLGSNDSAVGRARNRRVEFTVLNREVISR